MKYHAIITALAVVVAVVSCGGGGDYPPCEIVRLDHMIGNGAIPADSAARRAASLLFAVSGYGELNDSSVSIYADRPSVSIHRRAVDSAFTDISQLEGELGAVLGRASGLLPLVRVAGVYSVISPFNQSVFTVDSILYIGLNHYLGSSYGPYAYFPDYVRERKIPARLIPDIAESLVRSAYPYRSGGKMVARMLYEGAVVEAVMRLTGCDEAVALGYTPQQFEWLSSNEAEMWKAVIERRLLFSSADDVARSLIYPGPVTSVLHPEAPGAAGRFIGHRLIGAYLDGHSGTRLDSLLSSGFYDSDTALATTGYNP